MSKTTDRMSIETLKDVEDAWFLASRAEDDLKFHKWATRYGPSLMKAVAAQHSSTPPSAEDKMRFIHSLISDNIHGAEVDVKFIGVRYEIHASGADGMLNVRARGETLDAALDECLTQLAERAAKMDRLAGTFKNLIRRVRESQKRMNEEGDAHAADSTSC